MARTAFLNKSSREGALGTPHQWVIYNAADVDAQYDNIVADMVPVADTETDLTIAAQPDVPRSLSLNCEDANSSITFWRVTLKGTDFWGNPISEVRTAFAAGVIETNHAFRSLTSASLYVEGTVTGGSADLFSIGNNNKLGLPVRIKSATDILAIRVGEVEAGSGAAVDAMAALTYEAVTANLGAGEYLLDTLYSTFKVHATAGQEPDGTVDYVIETLSTWET